jgi:heat shock protein HslJ/membrane-bound inhibitor of C-type lysozyme
MRISTPMKTTWANASRFVPLLFVLLLTSAWISSAQSEPSQLGGTSWQLVVFHGRAGETLTPLDNAKYTITFATNGRLSAQIDCNRGTGTWKSSPPDHLEFGPLALTRAQCPPALLTDRLVGDWQEVRSYAVKDGHLFVSLGAEVGTVEFASAKEEPRGASALARPPSALSSDSPVTVVGPITYTCTRVGGRSDTLTATFYQTTPGLVLVVRSKETRPAFQVLAADGAKYEGPQLSFWDEHGEAMVTWSGRKLECKPQR